MSEHYCDCCGHVMENNEMDCRLNEHARLESLNEALRNNEKSLSDRVIQLEEELADYLRVCQNSITDLGVLQVELVVLTKDIEILRKANGHFAQTNFELEAENAELKRVRDAARDVVKIEKREGYILFSCDESKLGALAGALAEEDDEWQKGSQEDMMKDEH